MLTQESIIRLDRVFEPRSYQKPVFDYIERRGYKKALLIWPRRAGKDITTWYLLIRQALKRKGMYFYCLPTYRQCKTVVWDAIRNDEETFLSMIPKELVYKINNTEMSITLTTGSIIQLIGSNNYNKALVGSNCRGVVFSEFGRSDPNAFRYVSPILQANGGFCVLQSTPFGKNMLYELSIIAKEYKDNWFCQHITLDDTRHVDYSLIEQQLEQGEISQDFVAQEWFTKFEVGAEGSYYAHYINKLYLNEYIGDFAYIPSQLVLTAWDIGYRDSVAIIFFQIIDGTLRIIDFYENNKQGLEHYVKNVLNREYTYKAHVAPHDIKVHEFGSGLTRLEIAHHMGIDFSVAPSVSRVDGIEAVRATLPRCRFNSKTTSRLIKHLENYRQEYDHVNNVYKMTPLHDNHSHAADAMRYAATSYKAFETGDTAQSIEERFLRARSRRSSFF